MKRQFLVKEADAFVVSEIVSSDLPAINDDPIIVVGDTMDTPDRHGAVGDGIADDTQAVHDCFNSGATIIGLLRKYKTVMTTIPYPVKEISGGGGLAQIAAGQDVLQGQGLDDLLIDHIVVNGIGGNVSEGNNSGIQLIGCSNVKITRSAFRGLRYVPVFAMGCDNIIFDDNLVQGCSNGPKFRGVVGGSISRNNIQNGQYTLGLAPGLTLDSTDGHSYGICSDINVDGNRIRDWKWCQALLIHAGRNISMANNILTNVLIGPSVNAFNANDTIMGISISGNEVFCINEAGSTDPSVCITVQGYDWNHMAQNVSILGNTTWFGNRTTKDINLGAINLGYVQNGSIMGNPIMSPYGQGIVINNPCKDILLSSNPITGVQDAKGERNGIKLTASNHVNIRISNHLINGANNGVRFDSRSYSGVVASKNQASNVNYLYSNQAQLGITIE